MFCRISFAAPLLIALVAGCASQSTGAELPPVQPDTQDSSILDVQNSILLLEDRRSDGGGDLERLTLSRDARIRERALRALGRLPFPEHGAAVTKALERGLKDKDPRVRAQAAFGLGQRADPASVPALTASWKDEDPAVRARIVEAAGRFEDASLREEVLYALGDPSPLVRAEAALAPINWDVESSAAAVVDSALANIAARAPAKLRKQQWDLTQAQAQAVEPEELDVIWRALCTLSRRKSQRARDVFLLWSRAPQSVNARIFAMRGLANLQDANQEVLETLRQGLTDEDWRVAVEAARGLGQTPGPESILALEQALLRPNAHVRAEVAAALGYYSNEKLLARPILESCLVDLSPNVQARAIYALAKLQPSEAAADLETRALSRSPILRKAVAQAAELLPTGSALQLLDKLSGDSDLGVSITAIEGYGKFLETGGRKRARKFLASTDNGQRLAAVLALQTAPLMDDMDDLFETYTSCSGDISSEIQYEILKIAAEIGGDRSFAILTLGKDSNRAFNRSLANRELRAKFPEVDHGDPPLAPTRLGELPELRLGADNPRVEVRTTRGTLLFELHEDLAPVHVHNFITLARSGAYDGLSFHRVVPDFVVQGADYRGDGNGGQSWRSTPLRHEFNELEYVEGSLGMPRNADPDSGGSQFFVTHLPTPHLDGRYTLFGSLLQGFDVLGVIEQGDRVLTVRVRGE
ncbi:MAG: cyclophilin family peptidyl-prolyl cis-trans isomerase/HEAT repeat protein [Candidatus Paceibacteria bacterium]|jgi:cyclophilin family peptidyl-prolyl cis-trans isomerase/HEAT repeat protein